MGDLATSVFERKGALDGTNYRSWAFSVKMLLKAKELWGYVEGTTKRPEDAGKAQATWDSKDQLALSSIALGLKPSEQEHIYECTTAKAAWDRLEEIYSGKGVHRLLSLMKSLMESKLNKNGKGMKEYIKNIRQTANEITEIGYKLEDPIVITFILNGLSEDYRYLVVNLESQVESISFQDLTARLIDEETQVSKMGSSSEARILAIKGRELSKCEGCGRSGHTVERCFGTLRCGYCVGPGHDESNCYCKRYREERGMEYERPAAGGPR